MGKRKTPTNQDHRWVVLPGENLTHRIVQSNDVDDNNDNNGNNTPTGTSPLSRVVLGPGLRWSDDGPEIFATVGGTLESNLRNNKHVYYVSTTNSPLIQEHDRVVGILQDRVGPDGAGGDYFRVHLGFTTAILSNLAFEGATKRNKPSLAAGQIVYARVLAATSFTELALSCRLGPHDQDRWPVRDWLTNEGLYGILKGGIVLRTSTQWARQLLRPECVVLEELAKHPPTSQFEVAIGVNGHVWIRSAQEPASTIVIQLALRNAERLTAEQTRGMVRQLVYTMQKQLRQQADAAEAS